MALCHSGLIPPTLSPETSFFANIILFRGSYLFTYVLNYLFMPVCMELFIYLWLLSHCSQYHLT
jgi:hypothetical protein